MEINTQQISSLLKEKLNEYKADIDVAEVGEIRMVGDGVARIHGLENVVSSELLEFPNNVMGMALNLEEDEVGAVLFGDSKFVKEGDLVKMGVLVNLHYIPVHMQPYYKKMGFKIGDFPNAEQYYKEAISIPMFFELNEEDQNYVFLTLREILGS